MGNELIWLLITTAVALAAGGISGWVSAAYRRRELKQERIRTEILRWANPLLGTIEGLESRLDNILDSSLYLALDPAKKKKPRPVDGNWAIGYEYAFESTLFLFAEYFAWVRLLQADLSLELFESQEAKKRFDEAVWKVSGALSSWPDKRILGEGEDAQVFALQQRAIGEFLIVRDGDRPRVAGYPEFLAAKEGDPRFAHVLAPLEALLQGVRPKTKRYQRLTNTREALGELKAHCDELLAL